ncbi:glycosyltransferase family protein [Metabacillus fastidiosus]|uniref:glycosyltransferase family protein n=1 Tax=Metabacillus fastidiosus TaxID=1458 RepID=UPI002DBE17E4|nr:glycosyltransferase family protein [Metabacillus fastidiosus]MEC2077896.1 glycosyltransferase family protein [Metabacillus fastidiosus]
MKIVGIVQARMGSTRLHGKVLKKVNGIPLLQYQIQRMMKSKLIDELIIATTDKDIEEPILKLCKDMGILFYRGSEVDVLDRYYHAAKNYYADIVVRMTSDCPLIDPNIIDQVIQYYLDNKYDYVSNTQVRTYPRGMDTEVFSMDLLRDAHLNAKLEYEREHVTPYFYMNPDKYSIGQLVNREDNSYYRLTVDTLEDFQLISIIINDLYSKDKFFDLPMILEKFKNNPDLAEINSHIEQKKLGE